MDAAKFSAPHRQIARLLGTAGKHHRIVFIDQLPRIDVLADFDPNRLSYRRDWLYANCLRCWRGRDRGRVR